MKNTVALSTRVRDALRENPQIPNAQIVAMFPDENQATLKSMVSRFRHENDVDDIGDVVARVTRLYMSNEITRDAFVTIIDALKK